MFPEKIIELLRVESVTTLLLSRDMIDSKLLPIGETVPVDTVAPWVRVLCSWLPIEIEQVPDDDAMSVSEFIGRDFSARIDGSVPDDSFSVAEPFFQRPRLFSMNLEFHSGFTKTYGWHSLGVGDTS